MQRRALQLGLRGEALRQFGQERLLSVEDITEEVVRQRVHANDPGALRMPVERVYTPSREAAESIGLDAA